MVYRIYTLFTIISVVALTVFGYFMFQGVSGQTRVGITITTNPDLENGLVGHWTFDALDVDSGANQIRDRTVNANHGTTTGMNTATTTKPGRIGQGIELDGSDDVINIPDTAVLEPTEYTLTAWIKPLPHVDFARVMAHGDSSAGIMMAFGDGANNNKMRCLNFDSDFDVVIHEPDLDVSGNSWYHVACVKDATDITIFINGESSVSTASGAPSFAAGEYWRFGDDLSAAGYYFDGVIDDVRIYNRALATSSIQRLYELGATTRTNTTVTTNPTLEPSLLSHWTFDGPDIDIESATGEVINRVDRSETGDWVNHATSTIPGRIGQAIEFDGSDDEVVITGGDGSIYDFGGSNFTIAGWFKSTQSSTGYIVSADGITNERYDIQLQSDGDVEFVYSTGDVQTMTASGSYNDGVWHHFVAIRNGARTGELYIDGVLATADTDNSGSWGGIEIISDLYIGGNAIGGNQFAGVIDDVRVYNRALTVAEVERMYDLGATTYVNRTLTVNPTLADGLVGHWTFDGPELDISSSTNEILDRSGSGNDGNWLNHATSTTPGRIGQALDFDGADDGIVVTDDTTLKPASTVSVAVWARPNTTVPADNYAVFVRKSIVTPMAAGYMLHYNDTNSYPRFCVRTASTNCATSAAVTLTADEWHHIVGTYDGATVALYVNGEQVDSASASGAITHNTDDVYIGSLDDQDYFDGLIDDVRIYNRALSESEVLRMYHLGQ